MDKKDEENWQLHEKKVLDRLRGPEMEKERNDLRDAVGTWPFFGSVSLKSPFNQMV